MRKCLLGSCIQGLIHHGGSFTVSHITVSSEAESETNTGQGTHLGASVIHVLLYGPFIKVLQPSPVPTTYKGPPVFPNSHHLLRSMHSKQEPVGNISYSIHSRVSTINLHPLTTVSKKSYRHSHVGYCITLCMCT